MGLRKLFRARLRAAAPKQAQPSPIGLQVLFPTQMGLGAGPLIHLLQEQHPSLAQVRVEIRTGDLSGVMGPGLDTGFGQWVRAQWGRHTVLMAVLNKRIHPETLDWTVKTSYQDDVTKMKAQAHQAYAALSYHGEEKDPLEQYVALGMIAMAMARLGAVTVLNANASSCYPAQMLLPQPGEDADTVLRNLPLTALYVGFVRFTVENQPGVWIRTCGAPLMDLPDLAWHARGAEESADVYTLFNGLFRAMRSSQVRFHDGDTLENGDMLLRLRKPHKREGFLNSSWMIVLEPEGPAGRLT
jgi:hypothetical protein